MSSFLNLKRIGFVALAMLVFVLVPASAGTTGTLTLSGTAPGILEITVTAESGASSLEVSSDVNSLKVASILERSNKRTGYMVVLQSVNAGMGDQASLDSSIDAITEKLPYTLSYDGYPVSFQNGQAVITNSAVKTPQAGSTKDLEITFYGADANLAQGTYSDTLIFTISAP